MKEKGRSGIQEIEVLHKISAADPTKFLSFLHQTLPENLVGQVMPEIRQYRRFRPEYWRVELDHHNNAIRRGLRMGLSKMSNLKFLRFSTLENFVVSLKSAELAEVLDCLRTFAERVISKIRRKPLLQFWRIAGVIVITRESWRSFCKEALALASNCLSTERNRASDDRPDYPILYNAASKVVRLIETQYNV